MSGRDNTDHYEGTLLEALYDEFHSFAEAMAHVPADVHQLKDDMREVKTRLTTVEVAVTDLSKHHHGLESRVATLEQN